MSPFTGPNSVWWKIAAIVTPLVVGGIVGLIRIDSTVAELSAQIQRKADRDVVQANQDAILRELTNIETQLNELRNRR